MSGDHSVNLVRSRDLVHILQPVLYFTDRHFTGYLSVFGLFGPLIYRPDELCQKFFGFRASPRGLTSGKNFMVIRPAVPEILGGVVPPPPDAIRLSKTADAINR